MHSRISFILVFSCFLVLIFFVSCSFFEKPEVPGDLTAVYNEEGDYVELHWEDATGVSQYEVYRGDNDDPETFELIADPDEAWYDDFDYNYFERYYAVKAENKFGTSDFSEVVEANVPDHDKYEPNNDLASALLVTPVDDEPNDMHMSIMPAGDIDCIKFYAYTNHGYNIFISAAQCSVTNIQMTMYDENGNLVETGVPGGDAAVQIFEWQPDQAGYYILKIQAANTADIGYYMLYIIPWV